MTKKFKSLIIILTGLFTSFHFINFSVDDFFHSRCSPILFFIFLILLLWWLIVNAGFGGNSGHSGGVNLDVSDMGDANDGDSGSL